MQTPQWFYDIEKGKSIKFYTGPFIAKIIPMADKIKFGKNIFGTDPKLFYDIILRKRNAYNGSFCCGAGSIHRRDALLELSSFNKLALIKKIGKDKQKNAGEKNILLQQIDESFRLMPFVHHVSEDIYTSILLHTRKWKSYQHPNAECGMLSPQTLTDYVRQHARYAEGSLDIFFSKHNPWLIKGLNLRQRFAYFETLFSYLSPIWLLIFLLSPAIFFFTLTPPIQAFNFDFFVRFLSFMFLNILVTTIGNWGVSTVKSEQYFIAGFWIKLKALFTVITRKKISFNVTSKTVRYTNSYKHILPHLVIIVITLVGMFYNAVLIAKGIHPSYSAFVANVIWAFFNIYQMSPFIRAAFWKPSNIEL